MALMEVLAAAALLGAVLVAFFAVLRDAQSHLATARINARATALAQEVLADARQTWLSGPYSGARDDLSWHLSCRVTNEAQSARLLLIACTATIARSQRDIVSLDQSWAEPHSRRR
jgi:hypothetical protein